MKGWAFSVTSKWIIRAALGLCLAWPGAVEANDYPTETVVEYVMSCIAANGQTPDMLRRCACSIDVVASIIPYPHYEKAETILRMRQTSGDRISLFRDMTMMKSAVDQLRLAQIEADFRCF